MNNERIDIELMESRIRLWREGDISDEDLALEMDYMVPELKKCYAREDALLDALRIIRDDLDEAIDTGHVAIHATNGVDVTKIRNFANDATQ